MNTLRVLIAQPGHFDSLIENCCSANTLFGKIPAAAMTGLVLAQLTCFTDV
jgi:hypothetical protein